MQLSRPQLTLFCASVAGTMAVMKEEEEKEEEKEEEEAPHLVVDAPRLSQRRVC